MPARRSGGLAREHPPVGAGDGEGHGGRQGERLTHARADREEEVGAGPKLDPVGAARRAEGHGDVEGRRLVAAGRDDDLGVAGPGEPGLARDACADAAAVGGRPHAPVRGDQGRIVVARIEGEPVAEQGRALVLGECRIVGAQQQRGVARVPDAAVKLGIHGLGKGARGRQRRPAPTLRRGPRAGAEGDRPEPSEQERPGRDRGELGRVQHLERDSQGIRHAGLRQHGWPTAGCRDWQSCPSNEGIKRLRAG